MVSDASRAPGAGNIAGHPGDRPTPAIPFRLDASAHEIKTILTLATKVSGLAGTVTI